MNMHDASMNDTVHEQSWKSSLPLILVMLLGAFVAILNETFLNIALPRLSVDLGVSVNTVQWLTSSYLLVLGVLVPVTAFMVQRFTTRQLFFAAMSLFSTGVLIAGLSPNFAVLLIGRVVQAAGTALILPLLMNVVLTLIPARNRGTAMGWLAIVILVAPALGPTVSGWILGHASWRALFFAVLPIALAILAYSVFVLRNVTEQTKPRIDLLSFILSALGFGGLVFGASSAGEGNGNWSSPLTIIPLIVAGMALAAFVWRQFSIKEPLLDLRTFRYGMFSLSVVAMVSIMMSLFAALIVLPMYLESVRGLTPLEAGMLMLPGGLILGAMSPVTGRLFDRVGVRWMAPLGMTILVITLIGFANLTTSTSYTSVVILHMGFMFGVSMGMMPVMTNGLNQLPRRLYSHGSAIVNTVQQVSAALGTALQVTVISIGSRNYLLEASPTGSPSATQSIFATSQGIVYAFTVSAVLAGVGLLLSFFMRSTTNYSAKD